MLEPLQYSGASQMSVSGRQATDAGRNPSAGHVALVPVHRSAASQGPAAARHTIALVSKRQTAEQQSPPTVLPSSQSSPASTVPLPHTTCAAAGAAFSRPAKMIAPSAPNNIALPETYLD